MNFGEMKFKQRGREEQAEPDGTEVGPYAVKLSLRNSLHRIIRLVAPSNNTIPCLTSQQKGEIVGKLMGVDGLDLYNCLCKPKIKVGAEFVTQGRNVEQVYYSVGAISKALFDRMFKWLVKKCNVTLETGLKRHSFIGVLDIAGFEIFDVSYTDIFR